MKNKKGFVGPLVLLLAVAIIAVLFVRVYLTAEKKGMGDEVQNLLPTSPDGSAPQTRMEQLNSAKKSAEGVQGIVDMQGEKTQDALKGEGL